MIIFLLLSITVAGYLSVKSPTNFIIFYILIQSKFLGFIDLSKILILNNDLSYFIINLIAFLSVFFNLNKIKLSKPEILLILFFMYLYTYGLIIPVLMDYSTLGQAITSSKTFIFYSFLIYLIIYKDSININKIILFITYISYYLVTIEIIYTISNLSPPQYIEEYFKSSETYQRIYFPTYIALIILFNIYFYIKNDISKIKFYISNIYLLIGLLLSGYTSLFLSSIGLLLFTIFYYKDKLNILKGVFLSFLTFLLFYLFLLFNDSLRNLITKTIEERFMGNAIELVSRDYYNKFRWDAIKNEPLLGFGFIHKDAKILDKYKNNKKNRFMESFNVIDSGYVDLPIKFGYINTIIFLLFLLLIIKNNKNKTLNYIYILFIIQYLSVNYTWSVFTYQHGIIPLSIIIFLVLQNKEINLKKRNNNGISFSNNYNSQ